jgi:hypothetical protein
MARGSRIADRRRRRVEVKKELPNRRRGTSTGKQTDESLARFADRGSRIGADQYRIEGRGAGIAGRGTFQPAGGRRGRQDYTRKKDTKNPALGGVDRIGFIDQT